MDKHDNDYAITRDSLYGTTPEPTYAGITSFMRRKYTKDLTGVDVAVTGIPLDTATTNRPGARHGPRALRDASTMIRTVNQATRAAPFHTARCADFGDARVNLTDVAHTLALVEEQFAALQLQTLLLAGDQAGRQTQRRLAGIQAVPSPAGVQQKAAVTRGGVVDLQGLRAELSEKKRHEADAFHILAEQTVGQHQDLPG